MDSFAQEKEQLLEKISKNAENEDYANSEIDRINNQLWLHQTEITELKEKLENVTRERDDLSKENETLETGLNTELNEKNKQVDQLKLLLKTKLDEISKKSTEMSDLTDKLGM